MKIMSSDKPIRLSRPLRLLLMVVAVALWTVFVVKTFQDLKGFTVPVSCALVLSVLVSLAESRKRE